MKQKKLIVFMPSIEDGGVEKNFFIITNYLSSKFNNISVITLSNLKKNKLNKKINIICPGHKFLKIFGRRAKFIFSLFYLLLEILKNKNSKVLCFQGIVYCIILCKILSTKVIIRSNSSPSGWSKNLIKKIFYKKIYAMADKIIVNSLAFKKELKDKFNLKSICIYNPLNKREITKLSKKKIKNHFFKKNYLNIINVGRLNEQKDQICLLKAIKKLPKKICFRLLLIGDGNEKQMILNYIKKNKLTTKVKILPFQNNPFPYILKSNLLILSSKYEGLPNILLETITLKKSIISSDCPTGPREILDNGMGGILFKKGSYNDLANKIIYFNYNKTKMIKKINHAYKRLFRFDLKLNLYKYFQILNSFY